MRIAQKILLAAISSQFISIWAYSHPGGRDDLGCHIQQATGQYHCHTGVLKGRQFKNREEALAALKSQEKKSQLPPKTSPTIQNVPVADRPVAEKNNSPVLKVISWNIKHLGRKNLRIEEITRLLKNADIITFQEVNTTQSGDVALQKIATQIRKETGEKICRGLSAVPSNSVERYGYLWKNSRIGYVKTDGSKMEDCSSTAALVIRVPSLNSDQIVREPALGTFYSKTTLQSFLLASIHLVPSGDGPQYEVPPLFEIFRNVAGPTIIAGDYNLDSGHSAFDVAESMKFQAAMIGVKTSLRSKKRELNKPYDNFWYRDISLKKYRVINLHDEFPKLPAEEIYNNISDHCPIEAEFEFTQ